MSASSASAAPSTPGSVTRAPAGQGAASGVKDGGLVSASGGGLLLSASELAPMRPGDYTVLVHVISGRSLHPEDVVGTSDPFVDVEIAPSAHGGKGLFKAQTQSTKIIQKENDPVWDEQMTFSLQGMSRAALEDARITFNVYDADMFSRTMIGAHSVELAGVHRSPGHEFHRVWIGLMDTVQSKDAGTLQGMLRVSIAVLGAGDVAVTHTAASDERDDAGAGGTLRLPAGAVGQSMKMLELTVHAAEGLPAVNVTSRPNINAQVRFEMGGVSHMKTEAKPCDGERDLGVKWETRMTAPVLLPTLSDRITLSLYHERMKLKGGDLRLGTAAPISFRELVKAQDSRGEARIAPKRTLFGASAIKDGPGPQALAPTWLPVYGPFPSNSANWITSPSEALQRMQKVPETASAYLGSVLVSARVLPPPVLQKERKPKREPNPDPCPDDEPHRVLHSLRVNIFAAADLPPRTKPLGALIVCSGVGVGTQKLMQPRRGGLSRYVSSTLTWNETLQTTILLPRGPVLPDTFIYLYEGDATKCPAFKISEAPPLNHDHDHLIDSVIETPWSSNNSLPGGGPFKLLSYARGPTAQIIAAGTRGVPATWYSLVEDTAFNALPDSSSAGMVLARIAISEVDRQDADVGGEVEGWLGEVLNANEKVPYELRVHCFRGKDMPAADSDGSADPFVEVSFCGVVAQTSIREKTLFPGWFETLRLENVMLSNVNAAKLAPPVAVTVWDADPPTVFGVPRKEKQAELRFQLSADETVVTPADHAGEPLAQKPRWYALSRIESGFSNRAQTRGEAENFGSLLLLFQLIPKMSVDDVVPPPAPIIPPSQRSMLEITVLGLRDIRAGMFRIGRSDALAAASERSLVAAPDDVSLGADAGAGAAAAPAGASTSMISAPYVEFDAESSCGISGTAAVSEVTGFRRGAVEAGLVARTQTSTRPSPNNAAFCERLFLPATLPVDPLYCGVLNVTLRDQRLTGDVTLATGTIDLSSRLYWAPGFTAARTASRSDDVHPEIEVKEGAASSKNGAKAKVAAATKKSTSAASGTGLKAAAGTTDIYSGAAFAAADVSIAAAPPAGEDKDDFGMDLSRFLRSYDSAANAQNAAEREYLKDRREYERGLEEVFGGAVFDRVSLREGKNVGGGFFSKRVRNIGNLKCVVRVLPAPVEDAADATATSGVSDKSSVPTPSAAAPPDTPQKSSSFHWGRSPFSQKPATAAPPPAFAFGPPLDLTLIRTPVNLLVRVYVLKGEGMRGLDRSGKSDPYLKLCCGSSVQTRRSSYLPQTLSPEFFQMLELRVSLPGPPSLRLEVWDYNTSLMDRPIGATAIDIEDRWYDSSWQALRPKPIEKRNLWSASSTASQGSVWLWVDMHPLDAGALVPKPWVIERPPPMPLQVRVCIYGLKDVPRKKGSSLKTDLYVRGRMEATLASLASAPGRRARKGGRVDMKQETDVHYRSKGGEASFNWRLVFDVDYPCTESRLTLQLYDKDEFTGIFDQILGVHELKIGDALKAAAWGEGRPVQFFATQPDVVGPIEFEKVVEDPSMIVTPPPRETGMQKLSARARQLKQRFSSGANAMRRGYRDRIQDNSNSDSSSDDGSDSDDEKKRRRKSGADDDGDDDNAMDDGDGKKSGKGVKDAKTGAAKTAAPAAAPSMMSILTGGFSPDNLTKSLAKQARLAVEPPAPLPRHAAWVPFTADLHNADAEKALGIGECCTINALCIACAKCCGVKSAVVIDDMTPGIVHKQFGRVLVSVEVVPLAIAKKYAAGKGREAPNRYPVLPEPRGRLKCSWNPCKLLYDFLGPERYAKLIIALSAVFLIALAFTGLPFITSIITVINMMPEYLRMAIGVGIALGVLYALVLCFAPRICCACCRTKPDTIVVKGSVTELLFNKAHATDDKVADDSVEPEAEPLVSDSTGPGSDDPPTEVADDLV